MFNSNSCHRSLSTARSNAIKRLVGDSCIYLLRASFSNLSWIFSPDEAGKFFSSSHGRTQTQQGKDKWRFRLALSDPFCAMKNFHHQILCLRCSLMGIGDADAGSRGRRLRGSRERNRSHLFCKRHTFLKHSLWRSQHVCRDAFCVNTPASPRNDFHQWTKPSYRGERKSSIIEIDNISTSNLWCKYNADDSTYRGIGRGRILVYDITRP